MCHHRPPHCRRYLFMLTRLGSVRRITCGLIFYNIKNSNFIFLINQKVLEIEDNKKVTSCFTDY